jgi:hypothetical protein
MKKVLKIRVCPDCNIILEYYNLNSFYRARKNNSMCKSCSKLGDRNPFYKKEHSKETKEKISKKSSGINNSMFGIGGMTGKKQSDYQKQTQSRYMKERWAKEKGITVDELHKNWSEFRKYRTEVDRLTNLQPIKNLENFEKRGKAGVDGAYHLDHIYSVYMGFKNNIPPEIIAHISNLKMIPWMENQKKGYK